ncbi:hypothetical protein M758_11G050900 [Ceratodon purpureus]|nr:hypothetical protein M758_11G050900 [Ceratodon purpureus]
MREEDGARYLSPLVKQDLAKLDTDGDTRRLAVKSLKLFVEELDASTLPRFITQIAESREPGATRSYAISLYEEVARVHGKLVVPHIPKVMGALVRSSSASGSFPQLQVACARVTASLARYGIDSSTPQEEAEEIMREICTPLIEALSGKLEPVAASAAACIHALAESEKWRYVQEDIVHDVCHRTTVALSEKATRTAAHMQLIRILASVNPDVLSLHGANLLRAGEEILKVNANSWQLRKAAAQLLQSVLTILDKETLETELNPALHALDSCRLDKMPHVRAAVSEALHTAKMLASGNGATHTSFGMAASPIRKTSTDRSSWLHDDHVPMSPASKRGASPRTPMRSRTSKFSSRAASLSPKAASPTSQESRRMSFSPTSTSASEYSIQMPSPTRSKGGSRVKRAPLYPARAGTGCVHSPRSSGTPGTSPSSSTTTVEECESPSCRFNINEFNFRSQRTGVNGRVYPEEDEAGHGDSYLRSLAPLSPDALTVLQPTQLDILDVEIQKSKEAQVLKDVGTDITPPEAMELSITRSIPSELDPRLTQGVGDYDDSWQARLNSTSGRVEVVLPRLKLGSMSSAEIQHFVSLEHVSDDRTHMLKASNISLQTGSTQNSEVARSDAIQESSCDDEAAVDVAVVEVEKREIFPSQSESPFKTETPKVSQKHNYNAFAHLNVNSELDEKKDFPPLVTPKRLVRSLSNLSIPETRGSPMLEQVMKLSQDDPLVPGMISTTTDGGVLDAETSSEAGWSVRDNPIASEESYRAESSDDEFDGRGAYESNYPKPSFNVGSASPRDIGMISPPSKTACSFDKAATIDPISLVDSHEADEGDQPCPSCILAEQTFTSCRMRTPCQAVKSMQPSTGLSSLLHQNETNWTPDQVFRGGVNIVTRRVVI